MKPAILRLGLGGALLLCARSAPAQEAPRDFSADTPGHSYTPTTVAQGYFQIESDIVHVTQSSGSVLVESLNPVFKYGLTSDLELDLETDGLLAMTTQTANGSVHRTGLGDTNPAIKWNLVGNDSPDFTLSVHAGVKLPTAKRGLGNGAFEYNLAFPVQLALPLDLSLQGEQDIDLLKNAADTGKHVSFGETMSLSRAFGKVTLSVEAYAQSGTDAGAPPFYTADLGASYALTKVSVLTAGLYVGLNRVAPAVEGYTGFAFRF